MDCEVTDSQAPPIPHTDQPFRLLGRSKETRSMGVHYRLREVTLNVSFRAQKSQQALGAVGLLGMMNWRKL